MKKRKGPELYPGTMETEKERARAPNYDAFPGWTPGRVLARLGVD